MEKSIKSAEPSSPPPPVAPTKAHKQCMEWKGNILSKNNVVKFMMHNMAKMGCPLTPDHFVCQPCEEQAGGNFAITHGVVLCENHLISEDHTAETMVHEMVHAYDHCRVEINWNDCRHHACSEIRAANLSGDCGIFNELARGRLGSFYRHHQECVRRRAILSIKMNPACSGNAEQVVDEVFDRCFKDTEPFDEIY